MRLGKPESDTTSAPRSGDLVGPRFLEHEATTKREQEVKDSNSMRAIGEGGMAIIYLAKDLKHNRNVALKVLKPELAGGGGAERFLAGA